jgi:hypothetical protein
MRLSPHKIAPVILLLAPLPQSGQTPAWQAGIAQVIAKDRSPGSGFVVAVRAGRAYLVTAAHVVEGDPNPAVVFAMDSDKRRYRASIRDVEGGDPRGLAVLEIENPPSGLHAIGYGHDYPAVGASALVAGFPAAIGVFTVLPATIASIRGRDLFLSPETAEGLSGSPVLVDGRAVGLVYGRESGFGKAVVGTASVQPYLKGLGIEWGASGPQLKPGTVRTNPGDGQPYVWIPPGEFQMGCSPGDNECSDNEKPPHTVRITRGFWLGETEVTQAAYEKSYRQESQSLQRYAASRRTGDLG